MKYYLDTEFIEGFHQPFLGKKRHFIDLISIGLVAEDGRTYYAICSEFDPDKADNWVRENVLYPIIETYYPKAVSNEHGILDYCREAIISIKKRHGKSRSQIAKEIMQFVNPDLGWPTFSYNNSELKKPDHPLSKYFDVHNVGLFDGHYMAQPEFYAWYADYDWVVFCSLFGRMIDLPKGFPMYCRDIKQTFDEIVHRIVTQDMRRYGVFRFDGGIAEYPSDDIKKDVEKVIKSSPAYPKDKKNHNALDDALWLHKLHAFLIRL